MNWKVNEDEHLLATLLNQLLVDIMCPKFLDNVLDYSAI